MSEHGKDIPLRRTPPGVQGFTDGTIRWHLPLGTYTARRSHRGSAGKPWRWWHVGVGGTIYYPAYGTPGFGAWQTLKVDAGSAAIKWVRFSSQYFSSSPAVYGAFGEMAERLPGSSEGRGARFTSPAKPLATGA